MERRLLTFIIASTAFFFFYISLRVMFAPPAPVNVAAQADVEKTQAGDLIDASDDPAISANDASADVPDTEVDGADSESTESSESESDQVNRPE